MIRNLFFLLLLPVLVFSQTPDFDVRSVRWGMTKAQVMAAEKRKANEVNSSAIRYSMVPIGPKNPNITYLFSDNKLTSVWFFVMENRTDHALSYQDFLFFNENLRKKYGEPTKESILWNNDLFRNNPDKRDLAISLGHLSMVYTWDLPRTVITQVIGGKDMEINHTIQCESKLHKKLEKRATLKDF